MSNSDCAGRLLRATYDHPLTDHWSAAGGPWGAETLDDVLVGDHTLEARVAAVAGGLRQAGVEPGATIAWQMANGPDPLVLFRACWRLGAVAAPIHHLAGVAELETMLARLDPAVFLGPDQAIPTGPPIVRPPAGAAVPTVPAREVEAAGSPGAAGTGGATGTGGAAAAGTGGSADPAGTTGMAGAGGPADSTGTAAERGPSRSAHPPVTREAAATRPDRPAIVRPGEPLAVDPAGPRGVVGAARPADVAVALATSGSTGRPKLALHTHRGLVHKIRVMTQVHGLGAGDCTLMPAPFAHISGLLNGVLLTASGMRAVPMARWDPVVALELIERERVTFMIGPPTFFVSLVEAPGFDPARVRSLRQISCGGAGVTPAFVRSTAEALGCRVKRTYGSTEAPTVTTSTLDDPPERAAETDGRPVGLVELRVVDDSGRDRPPGQAGELWVRGPELFAGYDDPVATAAAFVDGGWFRTGDLGTVDADGWLTIVGRIKDVIIRGGENITTAEVEGVLEAHPRVRQAAVIGVPDDRLGERVCAFVVASGPFDLATCREWFEHQGITRFKWPERVEQIADLPLLLAGKPDRAALRHLATENRDEIRPAPRS